jgi:hypothetical protein
MEPEPMDVQITAAQKAQAAVILTENLLRTEQDLAARLQGRLQAGPGGSDGSAPPELEQQLQAQRGRVNSATLLLAYVRSTVPPPGAPAPEGEGSDAARKRRRDGLQQEQPGGEAFGAANPNPNTDDALPLTLALRKRAEQLQPPLVSDVAAVHLKAAGAERLADRAEKAADGDAAALGGIQSLRDLKPPRVVLQFDDDEANSAQADVDAAIAAFKSSTVKAFAKGARTRARNLRAAATGALAAGKAKLLAALEATLPPGISTRPDVASVLRSAGEAFEYEARQALVAVEAQLKEQAERDVRKAADAAARAAREAAPLSMEEQIRKICADLLKAQGQTAAAAKQPAAAKKPAQQQPKPAGKGGGGGGSGGGGGGGKPKPKPKPKQRAASPPPRSRSPAPRSRHDDGGARGRSNGRNGGGARERDGSRGARARDRSGDARQRGRSREARSRDGSRRARSPRAGSERPRDSGGRRNDSGQQREAWRPRTPGRGRGRSPGRAARHA